MEAAGYCETLVSTDKDTLCHSAEVHNLKKLIMFGLEGLEMLYLLSMSLDSQKYNGYYVPLSHY